MGVTQDNEWDTCTTYTPPLFAGSLIVGSDVLIDQWDSLNVPMYVNSHTQLQMSFKLLILYAIALLLEQSDKCILGVLP